MNLLPRTFYKNRSASREFFLQYEPSSFNIKMFGKRVFIVVAKMHDTAENKVNI